MLVKNLPFEAVPHITFSDSVYTVLALMQDYNLQHLATEHEGKFAGLISQHMLLEADEELTIGELQYLLQNLSVQEDEHFLKAVSLAASYKLSLIAVIDETGSLTGTVRTSQLLQHIAGFMHLREPGALIVLEIDPQNYSFSEISRMIEMNDAQITQFNTSRDEGSGSMLVTVRINKLEVSDIVATFQRYDYNVRYYSGEELYVNELKNNYENLMNYLNI